MSVINHSSFDRALSDAIGKALRYFSEVQLPSGEFRTIAAKDLELTESVEYDSTPFTTSFILHALAFDQSNPLIQSIAAQAVQYLLSQKEGPGIWRYWAKENEKHEAFPPDLDDTCCIAAALTLWGEPHLLIEETILENRNPSGLFYTWLVQRNSDQPESFKQLMKSLNSPLTIFNLMRTGKFENVDAAVIANVLHYLGEKEETALSIEWLIDLIKESREHEATTYYPDLLALYYMVSRAYHSGVGSLEQVKKEIVSYAIKTLESNNSSTVQQQALALCILENYDHYDQIEPQWITTLLASQEQNGNWKGEALFLGPAPYYGSDELTTSFCYEALIRYQKHS